MSERMSEQVAEAVILDFKQDASGTLEDLGLLDLGALLDEIVFLNAEVRERDDLLDLADTKCSHLEAEVARLRADLNYYQVEAVARTGTDARTKP